MRWGGLEKEKRKKYDLSNCWEHVGDSEVKIL